MTDEQINDILESLRAGVPLTRALTARGLRMAAFTAACNADPSLEQRARAAEAEGKAANEAAVREADRVRAAEREREEAERIEREKAAKTHAPKGTRRAEPVAWESAKASPAQEPAQGPLNLAAITREAATLAEGPFGFFLWLEAKLVAAGFPPVSRWWRATLRDFYASGKRWLVVMAGRGAGKSTLLTRVAVAEALFTARSSPPGEAWEWAFVSASTADARKRIRQIAAILNTIGMRDEKGKPIEPSYPQGRPTISTCDASGNPIDFVAYAGTVAGLSGPTSIGATVDEEAKLRGENSANPSGEVIITLAATFRARPGIRAIRCSSAWLTEGSHYGAVCDGDTIQNMVARIGDEFMADTLLGLEAVAQWEEKNGNKGRGDAEAARRVRTHASLLTSASPPAWVPHAVPTWLGNDTLGNPDGPYPWAGAAVASRVEMETLDQKTFEALFPGLTRAAAWLRECASVPIAAGDGGAAASEQCLRARDITLRLAAKSGHRVSRPHAHQVQPHPLAPPGDARYAGPQPRERGARSRRRVTL